MTDKEYEDYLTFFKDNLPSDHGYAFVIFSVHDGKRGRYHIATNCEPSAAIQAMEEFISHLRLKSSH